MIRLRPATGKEIEFLLLLRNDPLVRKNSFSQNVITPAEHARWLKKVLTSNKHRLFIICNEQDNPIGQIRFDVHKEFAEIHIALVSSARGYGYGREAITIGSKLFFKNNPQKKLLARIKENNTGSVNVFLSSGYTESTRAKGIIFLTLQNNYLK